MKQKIAVVCSGGGTRCAYSAGAMYALVMGYNIKEPHILVAASGSAGSVLYYATKQYDAAQKVWTNLLARTEFASLMRPWRILNVDYLIDTILKQEVPIDRVALKRSKSRYFIATNNRDTNNIQYFDNKSDVDVYEILRAAKAIPFLYNKMVCIDRHPYLDGDFLGVNINSLIQKAVSEGAELVIAINTSPTVNFWSKNILRLMTIFGTKRMRRGARRELHAAQFHPHATNKKIVYVCAPEKLPVGIFSNNRAKLTQAFDQGYRDTIEHPGLHEVFGLPSPQSTT